MGHLAFRERCPGEGAVRSDGVPVVDQDGDGQPAHRAHRLTDTADGFVDLVVARALAADVLRCGRIRLAPGAACRIRSRRRAGLRQRDRTRRLIAEGAGNPAGQCPRCAALLARLLAAQDLASRIVTLLGLFDDGEIKVCADLGVHAAWSQDRHQQGFDPADVFLFQSPGIGKLIAAHPQRVFGVILGARQKIAALVHYHHLRRLHARNARGDQMHDGGDLTDLETAPGMQLHDHRCAGLFLIAHEGRGLGQRQMHPRLLHRLQTGDAARQLDFEGMLVTRALHELGYAQTLRLSQHLQSHPAPLRQPLRREFQSHCMNLIARDFDGTGGVVDAEWNFLGLQEFDDLPGLLVGQAIEKNAVRRLTHPKDGCDQHRGQHGQGDTGPQRLGARPFRPGDQMLPPRRPSGKAPKRVFVSKLHDSTSPVRSSCASRLGRR